jgi:hypothetical protein
VKDPEAFLAKRELQIEPAMIRGLQDDGPASAVAFSGKNVRAGRSASATYRTGACGGAPARRPAPILMQDAIIVRDMQQSFFCTRGRTHFGLKRRCSGLNGKCLPSHAGFTEGTRRC